jgi:hypothetical protein
MCIISNRRHRFPPEIIQHAVWLYFWFPLSFRDVEDLLTGRGIKSPGLAQLFLSVHSSIYSHFNIQWHPLETPEFQRQSKEFAEALTARGHTVDLLVAEHCNHFEILDTLANPYDLLGRAALAQMGLGSSCTEQLVNRKI